MGWSEDKRENDAKSLVGQPAHWASPLHLPRFGKVQQTVFRAKAAATGERQIESAQCWCARL